MRSGKRRKRAGTKSVLSSRLLRTAATADEAGATSGEREKEICGNGRREREREASTYRTGERARANDRRGVTGKTGRRSGSEDGGAEWAKEGWEGGWMGHEGVRGRGSDEGGKVGETGRGRTGMGRAEGQEWRSGGRKEEMKGTLRALGLFCGT